jgi:bifunctional non-homologous end joining protein LigD
MASRWNSASRGRRPATKDTPSSMPSAIEPQLATLVDRPPARGEWSYEIKFDGYRVMVRKAGDVVQLLTRNGHDWSDRMPKLRDALMALPADTWLDGEAVVLDQDGRPNFNALQNAFDRRNTANIILFVFDLLWMGDTDVRVQPLRERRRLLRELMESVESSLVRFSEDFPQDPRSLIASACKMKLEGIIGPIDQAARMTGSSSSAIFGKNSWWAESHATGARNPALFRFCSACMNRTARCIMRAASDRT